MQKLYLKNFEKTVETNYFPFWEKSTILFTQMHCTCKNYNWIIVKNMRDILSSILRGEYILFTQTHCTCKNLKIIWDLLFSSLRESLFIKNKKKISTTKNVLPFSVFLAKIHCKCNDLNNFASYYVQRNLSSSIVAYLT